MCVLYTCGTHYHYTYSPTLGWAVVANERCIIEILLNDLPVPCKLHYQVVFFRFHKMFEINSGWSNVNKACGEVFLITETKWRA